MREHYEMPPEVTSLFGTTKNKTISNEDFVVINGRVMLPQEAVARFYDMSVNKVVEAVRYAQPHDPHLAAVVWHEGKMYFPTGDSVFAIKALSPYRNTKIHQNGAPQLNAFFDEIQNDLVDNKIHYEIARTPSQKNLNSKPNNLGCVLLIIILFFAFLSTDKKEPAPKQPAPVAVEKREEPKQPAPVSNPALRFKGHGRDSYADKDYVGLKGFVSVHYRQDSELYRNCDPPWYVPTYERDKQLWVESEITLEHKTPIVVLQTFLKSDRYRGFEGYILVKRLSDDAQFYIDVKNFITNPYWEETDLVQAAKGGKFLVEYHQRSDYWPVNSDNKKAVPPEGSILLVTAWNDKGGKPDRNTNQIWASGNDFKGACFNKDDLTIVY